MTSVGYVDWTSLAGRTRLAIDVNRHPHHADTPPHAHDFVEVSLVLDGVATHETPNGGLQVGAGDAFVIRQGAWHAFRDCEGLAVVNCCFRARLLERELIWLADAPRLRSLLWPESADGVTHARLSRPALKRCKEALEEIANPPTDEGHPQQVANLVTLLCGLARHLDANEVEGTDRVASVATAMQMMSSDLRRRWTVAELASAVAFSPAHFSRLFRGVVGRPPIAHLTVLRVEAAAAQLLRSQEPISAIGAAVGWDDPGYFARRFRAHFGATPSEYRRRR